MMAIIYSMLCFFSRTKASDHLKKKDYLWDVPSGVASLLGRRAGARHMITLPRGARAGVPY